jgi:ribulose-phosphate 3-epimerase
MVQVKIFPSILSADFAHLGRQVSEAEEAGASGIHVDVMDGHFVPNLTIGPLVVQAVRKTTSLPLDVHLMIEAPERYVGEFAKAGADIISVHQEACPHLHRVIQQIKSLGKQAGVVINPATPAATLEEIINAVDLVLVMSVNPGFGGQSFIDSSVDKIRRVRQLLTAQQAKAELEVDGGIDPQTAPRVVKAGASMLVAGSAIFQANVSVSQAIARLRASISDR